MNTPNEFESNYISATLAISEAEARYGTNRTLILTGGQPISISLPPGISNGQVIPLEGQYQLYPHDNSMTRLLLTIAVTDTEEDLLTFHSGSEELTLQGSLPFRSARPAIISRPQRSSWVRKVLLVVFALLIMIVSVELFFLVRLHRGSSGVDAATATATVAAMTDPYTHSGKLYLDDPLSNNSQGYSWQEGTDSGGSAVCQFAGGVYHATQAQKGQFHACFAQSTDFNNFVYEVQMTVFTGDYGGIVFCADSANSKFYLFRIGRDGVFSLSRYVDDNSAHAQKLSQGHALFIHTDLNQVNLLAVVVQHGTIDLYVNQQKIASYNDSAFTHGQIGVLAGSAENSADITFSNAKVWKL